MIFYYATLTVKVRLFPDRSCQLMPVEREVNMKNLVKTWLRRNRKGTYVYYLRWIGEDGREKYQSLSH